MSDESGGAGWWLASDGKWYPPESTQPEMPAPPSPTGGSPTKTGSSLGEAPCKKPWWRRWWAIALGIFVLLVVLVAIFADPPEDEDASNTGVGTTASTLDEPASPTTATATTTESESNVSTPNPTPTASIAPTADTTRPTEVTLPAPTTLPATLAPQSTIVVSTTVPPTATTTAPPAPEVFQGSGTDVITLDADDPIATEARALLATHSGGSNFIVTALDSSGNRVDGLVNHIGIYAGTRPWNFMGEEIAFIGVEADGPWELQFIPLQSLPVVPTAPGTTYEGESDQVVIFSNTGPSVVDFVCRDCSSNIIVSAWGSRRDGLINEIGNGALFTSSVIVPGDTLVLEIETSDHDYGTDQFNPGDWSLTVQ